MEKIVLQHYAEGFFLEKKGDSIRCVLFITLRKKEKRDWALGTMACDFFFAFFLSDDFYLLTCEL